MTTAIIIIGVVLLLVVLALMTRIGSLLGVAKGKVALGEGTSNKVNAFLMLAFIIIGLTAMFWYAITQQDVYTQPIASEYGQEIEDIFYMTTYITGAVFVITQLLLFGFAWKYRYNPNRKARFYAHDNKLEVIWTIVPAVVLAVMIFSGLSLWGKVTGASPAGAQTFEVVGQQFNWYVRYPGADNKLGSSSFLLIDPVNALGVNFDEKESQDDFMPGNIHLVVNKPAEVKIRSKDVLHNVSFPHFRIKMDAVPGNPTRLWFTPTKTTAEVRAEENNENFDFVLACQQICGKGHYSMKMKVIVETQEEYDAWMAKQKSFTEMNATYIDKNFPNAVKNLATR